MADQKNRGGQKQGNQQPDQSEKKQGTATHGSGKRYDHDKRADQRLQPRRRQPAADRPATLTDTPGRLTWLTRKTTDRPRSLEESPAGVTFRPYRHRPASRTGWSRRGVFSRAGSQRTAWVGSAEQGTTPPAAKPVERRQHPQPVRARARTLRPAEAGRRRAAGNEAFLQMLVHSGAVGRRSEMVLDAPRPSTASTDLPGTHADALRKRGKQGRYWVALLSRKALQRGPRRKAPRLQCRRHLVPLQRRRHGRRRRRPQHVGRDGVVAAGVLHHVHVDPAAALVFTDRPIVARSGSASTSPLAPRPRPRPGLVVAARPPATASARAAPILPDVFHERLGVLLRSAGRSSRRATADHVGERRFAGVEVEQDEVGPVQVAERARATGGRSSAPGSPGKAASARR